MKKTPRFTLLLVLLMIFMLFLSGCGSSKSPSEVVKTAYMKANKGKYTQASKYLIEEGKQLATAFGGLKELWDSNTRDGTIDHIEILSEKINGEGAVVKYKIFFEGGDSKTESVDLLKTDGKWKMAS